MHYGLDVQSRLIGQGYDGASVMNGTNRGVQQRVHERAPLAVYTHCYAHHLNFVLVDCCKLVHDAVEFLPCSRSCSIGFVSRATVSITSSSPQWCCGFMHRHNNAQLSQQF